MKATVDGSLTPRIMVSADDLPVGRVSRDQSFSILKINSDVVIVISNTSGAVNKSTNPKGWNIPRELMPEGTKITITT